MTPEVTVRGLLTAVDWYADGTARRVAVLTPDEREYEVEPGEMCRKLLLHLRGEVILRGTVHSTGDRQALRVTSFRVLPDEV